MGDLAGAGRPSLAASGVQAQHAQTQWSALKSAAGAGELYFEPKAAEQCAQACQVAADQIDEQLANTKSLDFAKGFGETQAGRDLAEKFRRKSVEARTVLLAHRRTLLDMRDTFRAAGRAYAETESANATKLQ